MSGPDHFREAERLLGSLKGKSRNERRQDEESVVAEAQVHAILALAAANVLAAISPLLPRETFPAEVQDWRHVTGS